MVSAQTCADDKHDLAGHLPGFLLRVASRIFYYWRHCGLYLYSSITVFLPLSTPYLAALQGPGRAGSLFSNPVVGGVSWCVWEEEEKEDHLHNEVLV